jgi:hypothetical protein
MSISKIAKDLQGLNQKFPPVENGVQVFVRAKNFILIERGNGFIIILKLKIKN